MDNANLPNFYNHNVILNQNEFLNLIQCGRDMGTPGFSYPHYNNFYIINIVKSGNGSLETRGKFYNLTKNDAFITYPNELSILTADSKDPWELCFFAFNGKAAVDLLQRTIFKDDVITVPLKDNSLSNDILDATDFMNNHSYSEFLTFKYLFKFLTHFDSHTSFPIKQAENREQKYVAEIKKYIQANYIESIKVADIADKLSINRSHLYRIFKNEIGMGVEDYIVSIRINHAKVLLKSTEFPVTTVAHRVGYKNYTTFFKRFKQTVGITPLEYRQRQKENNNQ
jgi:AraC-like DNA-binding protein